MFWDYKLISIFRLIHMDALVKTVSWRCVLSPKVIKTKKNISNKIQEDRYPSILENN